MSIYTIRRLVDADAEAFIALRQEGLRAAPFAFSSAPETDFAKSAEIVHGYLAGAPRDVLFGAFAPDLVGIVGLRGDRHAKSAHRRGVWGMYVRETHRRRGLARRLLEAALAHARSDRGVEWVDLCVAAPAEAAHRLYESMGFVRWGTQEGAIRVDGVALTEHHMALRLV